MTESPVGLGTFQSPSMVVVDSWTMWKSQWEIKCLDILAIMMIHVKCNIIITGIDIPIHQGKAMLGGVNTTIDGSTKHVILACMQFNVGPNVIVNLGIIQISA